MILPNVRVSFDSAAVHALAGCVAEHTGRPAEGWVRRARDEGPDALLDHPDASAAVIETRRIAALPAPLVFYVLVRRALLDADVPDPRIADYLATLLHEFAERGRAFRVARHDDKEYRYLVDLVSDLDGSAAQRRFLLYAHLGNFALWLAGLFPDHITARVHRKGAPGLGYYEDLGAYGYRAAADFEWAHTFDLSSLYRDAAALFRVLRRALNRISDRFLFPQPPAPADRLLRQVADELGLN